MVRPILFNTDMVRAILDGTKATTRRIVKSPYFVDDSGIVPLGMRTAPRGGKLERQIGVMPYPDNPYKINDILYVRETWAFMNCINCDGDYRRPENVPPCYDTQAVEYDDGDSISDGCFIYRADCRTSERITWRPSIHMPKEAARIWLLVTDVRVERLQDITDDDCMKEGIQAWTKDGKLYKYYPADKDGDFPNCEWSDCPRSPWDAMKRVWNSTIKKSELSCYGWDTNPWVWVIEFERCEKPEREG